MQEIVGEKMIKIEVVKVGFLETNCYLVYDDEVKEVIVVDPGDKGDYISSCIEKLELKPVAIFLTHAHVDHILGLEEVRNKYDVPIYIQEGDVPMLCNGDLNLGHVTVKFSEKDYIIKGEEDLSIGGMHIKTLATPGHTPGGGCYYFPDAHFVLAGDTMFRYSWGRTDFPGGSEIALMDSIRNKLLPLPEDTIVYPGHESATIIRDERKIHNYR